MNSIQVRHHLLHHLLLISINLLLIFATVTVADGNTQKCAFFCAEFLKTWLNFAAYFGGKPANHMLST